MPASDGPTKYTIIKEGVIPRLMVRISLARVATITGSPSHLWECRAVLDLEDAALAAHRRRSPWNSA